MARAKLTVHRKGYTRKAHHRKSYVRSDGIRVKASSVGASRVPASSFKIKDRGAVGRDKKVVPELKEGTLGGKGFFSKSTKQRHAIESKLAKRHGETSVMGKLSSVSVLNKRTNPSVSKKAKGDKHWVGGSYKGKKKVKYPTGFGSNK